MKNSREKNNSEWEMAFNNNTESFQLPIQNNLNIARFSVEKIVDTVLANDNKIYYKVKWQDTWEPEDRMMGICAQQIAEFWKEYYQRTQNNFQQQQEQHQASLTKQLHHVQQGASIGNLTPSFPQQTHQQQQSTMLIPRDVDQTQSNSVGNRNGNDLVKSQITTINDAINKIQNGELVNLHQVETQNSTQDKIVAEKQDQRLNQHQQTFQSVPPQILENSQNTLNPSMMMSLMSSNPQQPDQNETTSMQQQQTPLEFQIHNGNVVEKKSLSTTQSLLLQQRFIAANHLLKPCIPFLPSFSIIHENLEQEQSNSSSPDKNFTKPAKATTKKTIHICNVCSKEFKTQALLRRHSVLHEPTSKHEHKCQTCNKTFIRKTGLRRHELCHTSSRPHICEECGKGFKERSNLAKHQIIHSGERPHACDVCNARFRQLGHLLKHVLVHKPEKPFKCTMCDKAFKRKEHLKDHMVIHSNEFPFECEVCQKKFRFKTNLKVHVMQHDGRKNFVCEICNKAFSGKANLAQHTLCHNPSVAFSCDVCQKSFTRKAHLKRHLVIHRSESKLTCVFCKESFPDRPAYKKHLLTHTGSKPFACTVCEKRFGAKSYLLQHMLTHSDDGGTFECSECNKKFHTQDILDKHFYTIHSKNPPESPKKETKTTSSKTVTNSTTKTRRLVKQKRMRSAIKNPTLKTNGNLKPALASSRRVHLGATFPIGEKISDKTTVSTENEPNVADDAATADAFSINLPLSLSSTSILSEDTTSTISAAVML